MTYVNIEKSLAEINFGSIVTRSLLLYTALFVISIFFKCKPLSDSLFRAIDLVSLTSPLSCVRKSICSSNN